MNLNIEKAKELIVIFSRLSEENQNALLGHAAEMEFRQSTALKLKKSGKPADEKHMDAEIGKFLGVAKPLVEMWDKMDPNHHAALVIMVNEMSNGELTKEQYIDFVVKTRQLSIAEYIEKYIPAANIDQAREIYRTMREKK